MEALRAPLVAVLGLALIGCSSGDDETPDDPLTVGLLLSYTGPLAANSINSERALLMAIEAANEAGGLGGREIEVMARDTRSDPRQVTRPARELQEAGAAIVIGPTPPSWRPSSRGCSWNAP